MFLYNERRQSDLKQITVDIRMLRSSGIGRVIENILKRMIPQKKEWKFHLLGNEDDEGEVEFFKERNVDFISFYAPIYSFKEQIEFSRKIPCETDVFWSPHYNIPLMYKGKLIVTVHDLFHLAMPKYVGGIHKKLYARIMFNNVVKKANKIVCVSKFTAKELKKYTSVDEKKLNVIYNGIDEKWFEIPSKRPMHCNPYILFVGNIKPHKNLVGLLEAFKIIKDKIPHDLILVGREKGFITGDKKVKKLAKTMQKRVYFTEYIKDLELKQYMIQADILVFPSLYEGFGLPPLEALACGCPVLASNIAAILEICGDMVSYFDPNNINDIANKIEMNLNKTNMTNKENSKIIKEKYNWNITVEKMINIFN